MLFRKLSCFVLISCFSSPHAYQIEKLLYSDDFNGSLGQWTVEKVAGSVATNGGNLEIVDNGGTTVWLNKSLNDSIAIEYNIRILASGALTDINCFWMARDPRSKPALATDSNFFKVSRPGIFGNYDSMNTYYVGFGANGNTTFRFRRYYPANNIPAQLLNLPRDVNRVILQNHDSDGLFKTGNSFLVAAKWYKIRVTYFKGLVEYFLNGVNAFSYREQNYDTPYNKGFFGFRTTASSHLEIDSFRVYQLTGQPTSIKSAQSKAGDPLMNRSASPIVALSGKTNFPLGGQIGIASNAPVFYDPSGHATRSFNSSSFIPSSRILFQLAK